MTALPLPLAGRTVAVTAERRGEQQAELLRKRGASVLHVPTLHTVDLRDDAGLRQRTEELIASPPDWTVATTGFGMRLWFEAADGWGLGEPLVAALSRSRVVARGPKAQSACRQRGLEVVWQAPDESMAAVARWLADQPGVAGSTVAVQLFDTGDDPATASIGTLASVVEVPVYRWRHPDDTGAVVELARRIVDGDIDAVTFTSQPAVRFLHEIAAGAGLDGALVTACNTGRVVPVCVGPVCAEAGEALGITTMIWPEPFRLAPMIRVVEEALTGLGGTGVRSST